jgi:CheY-like chemotaxis protein
MSESLPVLFVGDPERAEFRAAAAKLTAQEARSAPDIPAALELLNVSDFSPVVIVLAEIGSQPHSANDLAQLRRSVPLARLVRLLDPWLEGEGRTSRSVPVSFRAQWHQSVDQFPWSLPPTASQDDCLLVTVDDDFTTTSPANSAADALSSIGSNTLIAICARDRETAQSLSSIFTAQRWKSLCLRTPPTETPLTVDAAVFDLALGTDEELTQLTVMKSAAGAAPLIALLGFPRPEDVARLQSAGATAVIAKPFLTANLIHEIEQLLSAKSVS